MNHVSTITAPRAVSFSPDALAYEAFRLASAQQLSTRLMDPLTASSLNEALAEATSRWSWNRGDRLGIREIGGDRDVLHVYAVRQKSTGSQVWHGHVPSLEYRRWLDLVCTVDLNVIAGLPVGLVGGEHELHLRRQLQRPEGARLERDAL